VREFSDAFVRATEKALLNKIAPCQYLGFKKKTNVHMDLLRFFAQMTN
jgi:hypothetical protein